MKTEQSRPFFYDATSLTFAALLFLSGFALLIGNNLGIVSLDRMEHFWPLAIVAAGLVELLSSRSS